jgi:hypothetical protein
MMMRHEDEDYGEETRDLIEELRRLGGALETPPELRPHILARAQELLPCNRGHASRWWSMLVSWRPHPLVWGPVVAVACFMAGMLFSPTQLGTWRGSSIRATQEIAHQKRTTTAPPSLAKEEAPPQPAAPPLTPQDAARQRPETRMAAGRSATARPSSASPHPPVEVTTVLPAALYERLVQEAQRRHQDPSTLLHEAAEAYLRGTKPGE